MSLPPLISPQGLRGLVRSGALLLAVLAAGCDSAEERAENHYRRGLELAAEGDLERATLEFRNVFRLNGNHSQARLDFARILRDAGDLPRAMAQYLRLVETDRRHVEGHRELAELALRLGDFETLAINADRAFALAPEDPTVRALKAMADFRRGEGAEAIERAEAVIAEAPEVLPAHLVVIAERMAARDWPAALARADAALAVAPADEGLHLARLAILERSGDTEGAGEQLRRMAALFPGNEAVSRALVSWHLAEGDTASAEAILRDLAARAPDRPEGHLAVVQLRFDTEGPEAARAELDRLITQAADPRPFRRARAELDFAEGRTTEAIAALEAVVAGAEPSDETRDAAVALAGMLRATGKAAEAEARIQAVLEADPGHVEALKLRARTHLGADRPEAAVADLRAALGQAPADPEIMSLMATAHEREGAHELAAERLALAVELSGSAPAESLRYARFLLEDGRAGPAEDVLLGALRRAPGDPDLLAALGGLHLARGDAGRARRVAEILTELDDPAAARAATALEMAALESEGRTADTIAMLERLAAGPDAAGGGLAARAGLVRAHLAAGDLDAAEEQVEALLAAEPESLPGRMMRAGLAALRGETAESERAYRALAAAVPASPEPHGALYALLAGLGRTEEAGAALAAGIAATGGDPQLRFIEAGLKEAEGDFEGAIAIYEDLYAADRDNLVLANNLASLIATHRSDGESLERAHGIARRLRGAEVPQFQDTYGWILARRGQPEEALAYLEPAAASLEGDPLVQYHLGMAYFALDRHEEARRAFARAVEIAGEASPLPQIAEARSRIAAIEAERAAGSGG